MKYASRLGYRLALAATVALGVLAVGTQAKAEVEEFGYHAINPTMANKTVTLTGKDLTIEQVMQVARYGAKVQLSSEAKQRELDNYGLLLQAPTNGISVYWFTRGAGGAREIVQFEGDPTEGKNKEMLERRMLAGFQRGYLSGDRPEITEEALVRAVMVIRANAMTHNAPSPQLSEALQNLINKRITPVMQSRGSVGEGDLSTLNAIGATMVGAGECYYNGVRMPAADALKKAGLKPIQPFAADDNALTSSNAYATALAVMAVNDGREALEWADIIYAMDLNGMNSSIEPLSYLVQTDRPFPWLNWNANRVMEMIKGSYLFDGSKRIIQDPESLRASSIRQASAWKAWGTLRDTVVIQLNSSDHNPAIRAGLSPNDSWDLQTPEMMKYFVKGGKHSNGKSGFIFSNANWDPYPMANDTEAFTIALANMNIAIMLRTERFQSDFFTAVSQDEVRKLMGGQQQGGGGRGFSAHELMQEVHKLMMPVPPEGYGGSNNVEELEAQTRIKGENAVAMVDETFRLLTNDIGNASRWLDIRKAQDAKREFGAPVTAAWNGYKKAMDAGKGPDVSMGEVAYNFLRKTPASTYFSTKAGGDGPSPLAEAAVIKKASR